MANGKSILLYSTLVVVFLTFSGFLLVRAQTFLVPLTTAGLLTLLVLPLSRKMEFYLFPRALASFLNTILLLLISIAFFFLISFQIKNIGNDWEKIKVIMEPKMELLKEVVLEHAPGSIGNIDLDEINFSILGNKAGEKDKTKEIFHILLKFSANFLLTFVYIFFILNYRRRFKEFLLRLFPENKNQEVRKLIDLSARVAQQYLVGRLVLIFILSVLYSVGLGISGVDNYILISLLAAVLSLIPYIGNIIGFGIAMTLGYFTTGETAILVGIIITFSVAQFVESYILEPYVVGDRVDLHPFFVILAVIAGNSLWGIAGMVLSIPILAIINVIFLEITDLHPFGFLLSNKNPAKKQ